MDMMDSGNEVVHSDINELAELARVRPFLRTLRPLRQLVYCAYFVTIPIGSGARVQMVQVTRGVGTCHLVTLSGPLRSDSRIILAIIEA